jgi:threonine/homoserine/homoserine lactone efflux protein
MHNLSTFLTFYAAVLVIQLSPGPDMVLVIGRGIGQGRRTALMSAAGMTLVAGLVQIALLVLGIASLLQASPIAFQFLRWTGAAYLIWLGLKLLIGTKRRYLRNATATPISDRGALREGMINNLTNPKALAFLFAFLPQFVDPTSSWPVVLQLFVLGAVTKLSNFAILSGVAIGSGTLGGWIARRPTLIAWQERFAGVVMISLGLRLALSGDVRSAR